MRKQESDDELHKYGEKLILTTVVVWKDDRETLQKGISPPAKQA